MRLRLYAVTAMLLIEQCTIISAQAAVCFSDLVRPLLIFANRHDSCVSTTVVTRWFAMVQRSRSQQRLQRLEPVCNAQSGQARAIPPDSVHRPSVTSTAAKRLLDRCSALSARRDETRVPVWAPLYRKCSRQRCQRWSRMREIVGARSQTVFMSNSRPSTPPTQRSVACLLWKSAKAPTRSRGYES